MTYKPKSSLCVLCVLRVSVVDHKPNHSPQEQTEAPQRFQMETMPKLLETAVFPVAAAECAGPRGVLHRVHASLQPTASR